MGKLNLEDPRVGFSQRENKRNCVHPVASFCLAGTTCWAEMAALKRRRAQAWPEEQGDREHGLYSLHRMFDIVGTHLTHRDVRVLSFLFVDVIDDYERGMIRSGRDFLLALERQGRCDETNFRQVLQLLRIITRHDLLPYVTLKRRRAGECSVIRLWPNGGGGSVL